MSALNLIRFAKVIALLAFILPWAAVSCQGADLATSTGIEMMQGKVSQNPAFEREIGERFGGGMMDGSARVETGETADLGLNPFAIGAAAVILVGLVLSFMGAARSAARNTLVTSLLGVALAMAAFWWFRESVITSSARDDGGRAGRGGFGAAETQLLDSIIQQRYGLWINVGALLVAAGAAGMVVARRENA